MPPWERSGRMVYLVCKLKRMGHGKARPVDMMPRVSAANPSVYT